jgi:hypothetical protein
MCRFTKQFNRKPLACSVSKTTEQLELKSKLQSAAQTFAPVPSPRRPPSARGNFRDNESALSLSFEITGAKVNDGYGGRGKLEATATAPPSKKRAADEAQPL